MRSWVGERWTAGPGGALVETGETVGHPAHPWVTSLKRGVNEKVTALCPGCVHRAGAGGLSRSGPLGEAPCSFRTCSSAVNPYPPMNRTAGVCQAAGLKGGTTLTLRRSLCEPWCCGSQTRGPPPGGIVKSGIENLKSETLGKGVGGGGRCVLF